MTQATPLITALEIACALRPPSSGALSHCQASRRSAELPIQPAAALYSTAEEACLAGCRLGKLIRESEARTRTKAKESSRVTSSPCSPAAAAAPKNATSALHIREHFKRQRAYRTRAGESFGIWRKLARASPRVNKRRIFRALV